MIARAQVVATVRAWRDTPFVEQQHVRGAGCDCAGLLIGVAKELGEVPPEFSVGAYKQVPDKGKLHKLLATYLRGVPLSQMQPGDVVEFSYGGEPYHAGILVDWRDVLGVVHAVKARGRVVEHRLAAEIRARISAAFSYPSVA